MPSITTAAASPGQLMHEFMLQLSQGTRAGSGLATMHAAGVTLPQMMALHILHTQPTCTVNELAEALGLPMSTTSVLVQRLVEKKWARRTENPNDRREKQLSLSKSGLNLITDLDRDRAKTLTRSLADLPKPLREEFLVVVGKCLAVLRAMPARIVQKDVP